MKQPSLFFGPDELAALFVRAVWLLLFLVLLHDCQALLMPTLGAGSYSVEENSPQELHLPLTFEPEKSVSVYFPVYRHFFSYSAFEFRVTGCVEELKVNSTTLIDPSQRFCDIPNGRVLKMSAFLQTGRNDFRLRLSKEASPGSFHIKVMPSGFGFWSLRALAALCIAVYLLSVFQDFRSSRMRSPSPCLDLRVFYKRSLIVGLLLTALGIRLCVLDFESGDMAWCLRRWYQFISQHPGMEALKHRFTNYNPPYEYLLLLARRSFLAHLPDIHVIKSISIFFDFVAAVLVYKITQLKYAKSSIPVFASLAFLFAPTVLLNSSVWGQCDVLYTTFLLACFYCLCRQRWGLAFLAFGVSVSFKLQAMFLFPLLLGLFCKRHVRLKHFGLAALSYALMLTPAALAGRPIRELALIYSQQYAESNTLSGGATTLYIWISNSYSHIASPAGLILGLAATLAICLAMLHIPGRVTKELLIRFALLSLLAVPYVLPRMHDRYFFPADVFSIIYGFFLPSYFFVPLLVTLSSVSAYVNYLTGSPRMLSLETASLLTAITIAFVIMEIVRCPKNADNPHTESGLQSSAVL